MSLEPCFILHRQPYANTSLLVECFTPGFGRLPAIARGAGRPGKSSPALLQPFVPLQVHWSGRGEVKTLTRFETETGGLSLQGRTLYCGFYLNELLMRLLERHEPQPRIFTHYASTLQALASGEGLERILRQFELALLGELGYGLLLDRDADSGIPLDAAKHYHYRIEHGPVAVDRNTPDTTMGRTLLALSRNEPLDPAMLADARRLTRRVLANYLGDRPLYSRELFRSFSRTNHEGNK